MKCGASSLRSPARRLKTPAGRSLVAMISEKVRGASAFAGEASTMTLLPLAMIGAITETIPSKAGSSGASAATTPVGSGIVKLKCAVEDRIYRSENLRKLVGPTGVINQAINRGRDFAARPRRRAANAGELA